jgi:hypothetical protein
MKRFIAIFLGLNLLLCSLFNSVFTFDSDVVWPYLLLPHFFKDKVYLGPDTFFLHYPSSYLLTKILGLSNATVFLDSFVLIFIMAVAWLVFYFYFLRKYLTNLGAISILPAFLFINFSKTFFQAARIPSLRNIEFSFALLLSIYFDNYLSVHRKKLLKLGIFLLVLLLFISDPYFIYVFAVPLLLVLLIKTWTNSKYVNAAGFLIAVIVTNTLVRNLINKTNVFMIYGVSNAHIVYPSKIISNIDLTVKSVLKILDSYPNFQLLSFLSLPIFLLGVYGLWIMFKKGLADKKNIIQLLLPLCFVFTILVYIASGQPTDIETYRYLIFIVFIIPFGICFALSKLSKYIRISIALGIIVLSLANLVQMSSAFKDQNQPQFENNRLIIQAAQQNNLYYGYTSYWNAGINTFLSGNTTKFVQVACVNGRIQPFRWLASESWFAKDGFKGKTFLMIDYRASLTPELKNCSLSDVTKQFGKPAQIILVEYKSGSASLMIFDYNIAEKF